MGHSRRGGRCAPAVLFLLSATVVTGQEGEAADAENQVIEEVVVTGSRIKRTDFVSISPIVTLDEEMITLSGITAMEDLVNDAPQLVPLFDRTGNNPGRGAATLSLRGLGSNRTLVTLNGRRLAPFNAEGGVDINTIPARLVERVEIVTGGASTVYGSDAVAGVVNFLLDDDFQGVEAVAQVDAFEEGDGEVLDVSLTFGAGSPDARLVGYLNYQERDAVFAGDRDLTEVSLRESFGPPTPGALVPSGSIFTPAGVVLFPTPPLSVTGNQPIPVTFDPDGSPRAFDLVEDQFNFQPFNYLQTPLERESLGLFGHRQFSDRVRGFTEVLVSRTDTGSQLAAPVAPIPIAVNLDHPLLTPAQRDLFTQAYDPDGDGVANLVFGRRFEESGPRRISADGESLRIVIGVDGSWAWGWDWEAYYSHSDSDRDVIVENGVLSSRFQQGLLVDPLTGQCFDSSNACVPLNPFGPGRLDAAALSFVDAGSIVDRESVEERIIALNTTGEAVQLPAGGLGVAMGLEWREIESSYRPDPAFIGGGVIGYNAQSPVVGSFSVGEVYFESLVPLLADRPLASYLGIEAGYRYSDYELSGTADNWKFGIDWSPIESLRLRVMAQRAIRAPNIDELFRQPREQPSQLLGGDECAASADPVGNGVSGLCIAQGLSPDQVGVFEPSPNFPLIVFADGGNLNLDPEEADTLTAGLVFQPARLPALSITLDYYAIEIDNAIGSVSLIGALGLCFDANDIESPFCRSIVRGPSGDIIEFTNPQFNLARRSVKGVDVALDYRHELGDALAVLGGPASLSLRLLATHTIENVVEDSPLSPAVDCAGFFGGACSFFGVAETLLPGDRASTRLTYESGPLTLALNWQWIGSLDSHLPITCDIRPEFCYPSELTEADSRNYFEISGRYALSRNAEIFAGVSNVFEEDAPLLGFGATQSNTAPQLYDVFGRRLFVGFRYSR